MAVVAGIALPEGNPGAVESAATTLSRAGGDFDSAASTVRQAEGDVTTWRGIASFTFRDHCGIHSEAARAGGDACQQAAVALRRYGRELEDARERVRELQRKGEECERRIGAADARAGAAALSEASAQLRGLYAALGGGGDAGALQAAQRDAEAARAEREQAQREAEAAREELRRLQERAEEEREQIERKARATASTVRDATGLLPTVQWPAPPPVPQVEEEDGGFFGGVLTVVHGGLDGLGFIPAAGAVPDLINAGIYGLEGKGDDALWSMGAAVPLFGDAAKGGKMVKEGVEAATKAGRAADAAQGVVRVGDRALPAFSGKAEGVLRAGSDDVPLKSGYDGPSANLPKGTPGMHGNIKSHVEAHAAAVMRLEGVQQATLYINRIPCADARPPGCHLMLPRMLPEGAELTVFGPDGFKWVYRGIPD
jgi:hypothetical protein